MRIAKLLLILLLLSVTSFPQTPPPTNLKAILVVSVISGSTNIQGVALSWDYGQTASPVYFNIYRKVGPIASLTPIVKIATTNQKTYLDTQIILGTTYSYFVTAVINKIESMPSNYVQITIPPPPVIGLGKISGHLYDDFTKAPITNGTVTFIPANVTSITPISTNNLLISVKTDINGNFTIRLKVGVYYIYSSAKGYFSEFYDHVKYIQNATKVTLNGNDSLYFSIGLTRGVSILAQGADVNLSPDNATGVINDYELQQNYPNPFNPSTIISYQIPQNSFVTLKIYNILGKEVATLVNEQQTAGKFNFNFMANNLTSGIYIYKLTAGNFTSVKKLTLLK